MNIFEQPLKPFDQYSDLELQGGIFVANDGVAFDEAAFWSRLKIDKPTADQQNRLTVLLNGLRLRGIYENNSIEFSVAALQAIADNPDITIEEMLAKFDDPIERARIEREKYLGEVADEAAVAVEVANTAGLSETELDAAINKKARTNPKKLDGAERDQIKNQLKTRLKIVNEGGRYYTKANSPTEKIRERKRNIDAVVKPWVAGIPDYGINEKNLKTELADQDFIKPPLTTLEVLDVVTELLSSHRLVLDEGQYYRKGTEPGNPDLPLEDRGKWAERLLLRMGNAANELEKIFNEIEKRTITPADADAAMVALGKIYNALSLLVAQPDLAAEKPVEKADQMRVMLEAFIAQKNAFLQGFFGAPKNKTQIEFYKNQRKTLLGAIDTLGKGFRTAINRTFKVGGTVTGTSIGGFKGAGLPGLPGPAGKPTPPEVVQPANQSFLNRFKKPKITVETPVVKEIGGSVTAGVPAAEFQQAPEFTPVVELVQAIEQARKGEFGAVELYLQGLPNDARKKTLTAEFIRCRDLAMAVKKANEDPLITSPDPEAELFPLRVELEERRDQQSHLAKKHISRNEKDSQVLEFLAREKGWRQQAQKIPLVGSMFKSSYEKKAEEMLKRRMKGETLLPEEAARVWNERRMQRGENALRATSERIASLRSQIEILERKKNAREGALMTRDALAQQLDAAKLNLIKNLSV